MLQEREVLGHLHQALEVSAEGAGLERGEEGVEFVQVRALTGLLLFHGFDEWQRSGVGDQAVGPES